MKKSTKRISLLLVFCMVLTLLPGMAFAQPVADDVYAVPVAGVEARSLTVTDPVVPRESNVEPRNAWCVAGCVTCPGSPPDWAGNRSLTVTGPGIVWGPSGVGGYFQGTLGEPATITVDPGGARWAWSHQQTPWRPGEWHPSFPAFPDPTIGNIMSWLINGGFIEWAPGYVPYSPHRRWSRSTNGSPADIIWSGEQLSLFPCSHVTISMIWAETPDPTPGPHAITWDIAPGAWPVGFNPQATATHNNTTLAGTIALPGVVPTRTDGYTFGSWNPTLPMQNVTEPQTITVNWVPPGNRTLVHTWEELRAAVNNAPANYPTTLRITANLTAPNSSSTIVIPADRNIVLESSVANENRDVAMTLFGHRHFAVYGELTLGNRVTLRSDLRWWINNPNAGGVQVNAGGTFTMLAHSTIAGIDQTSSRSWWDPPPSPGGAVYLSGAGATFVMEGGSIDSNAATHGGGVFAGANTVVRIYDGIIRGNRASGNRALHGGGGAIFVDTHAEVRMYNGHISENRTSSWLGGGGVFMQGGTFTMADGLFSSNYTYTYGDGNIIGRGGGAVSMLDGTFTMIGGAISGNFAHIDVIMSTPSPGYPLSQVGSRMGGGILQSGGTITIEGGEISNNWADMGGGIFQSGGTITVEGGEISNNIADMGGGVAVRTYAENAFTMTGGVMRGNRASQDGGAIFAGSINLTGDWLPDHSLPMLDIRDGVIFDGNTAGRDFRMPPQNASTATQIRTSSNSLGFMIDHPLNNFDINFGAFWGPPEPCCCNDWQCCCDSWVCCCESWQCCCFGWFGRGEDSVATSTSAFSGRSM